MPCLCRPTLHKNLPSITSGFDSHRKGSWVWRWGFPVSFRDNQCLSRGQALWKSPCSQNRLPCECGSSQVPQSPATNGEESQLRWFCCLWCNKVIFLLLLDEKNILEYFWDFDLLFSYKKSYPPIKSVDLNIQRIKEIRSPLSILLLLFVIFNSLF